MKTITLTTIFLLTLTAVFGQTIENGVRIICTCEVWKFMQIPPSRRNDMAYSVQPSCPLHKPPALSAPEGFFILKRKKHIYRIEEGHISLPPSVFFRNNNIFSLYKQLKNKRK